MALEIQLLTEDMYSLVTESSEKRYKPQDIFKLLMEKYEKDGVRKKDCKIALKNLIDTEKLVYTVLNGSCTSMVGLPGCED